MSHETALELLPWFVNRTVTASEREQLERHVADCLICRAELKAQRALRTLVEEQPTAHWSAQQGFDRLSRRLDGRGPSRFGPRAWLIMWPRSARLSGRASRRFGGAIAVAVTIALVIWIGVDSRDVEDANRFSTLTQGLETAGVVVDIIFAAGLSEADMRVLLQAVGGTIVAGPSALGRYTVRIEPEGMSEASQAALMELLRADPRVRFAGKNLSIEPAAERE